VEPEFLRLSHEIRDSGSCRELEAEIVGAYIPFWVFIYSPKCYLKTPSGLGDPPIRSLGCFSGFADSHLADRPRGAQFFKFITCFSESWVFVARHGQSAGVGRSEVNRRMTHFSW
jgi:hypothetical protein